VHRGLAHGLLDGVLFTPSMFCQSKLDELFDGFEVFGGYDRETLEFIAQARSHDGKHYTKQTSFYRVSYTMAVPKSG